MSGQKTFTLSLVAQHRSKKDCWFVINGRVLDVTKFLDEHPAGGEVLVEVAERMRRGNSVTLDTARKPKTCS
ncbi:hypothetical protein NC652_032077 [Populus alba x Populus x berolinensis]|nr:hypothetical protein NC651_037818 [Populus alba x Populus x berolinensis]KAJ6878454.1 hypothetical protein NC652_032077 [Populus alba x Populus x berolinensis]